MTCGTVVLQRPGKSKYNPVFENFQFDCGPPNAAQLCDMRFTSVLGHVLSFEYTDPSMG